MKARLIEVVAIAAVLYYLISMARYALTNPELTQTQIFLSLFKALSWQ